MLFTCGPRTCAASRPAARKVVKRGNKSFAVDLHCHVHTPAADDLAKQGEKPAGADWTARYVNPRTQDHQQKLRLELDRKLTSVEQRLSDMDRMGIDVQAISTSPLQYYYALDPDLGRETSRAINERLAQIASSRHDRFVALGTVPLQSPELAVAELKFCMKLGFRGIEIGTNVNGTDLSDARFEALFAQAERLGAIIFLHPIGFTDTSRLTEHFLTNVIGNPLDTTLALSHIVFGGVLERHPRLKLVAAHGGGYLGHYPARMDHAYRVRPECHDHIKRPPSFYMKKIYFDTLVFSPEQLEHLVSLWGADHVVIGTDYPYDMGYYRPVDFVENVKSLTRAQKDAIIGGNAAKLLKIKPRRKVQRRG